MGENFVENKDFFGKRLECSLVLPNNATPPNFKEKTFANSHKTSKFVKVFSLKCFLLYGIVRGKGLHPILRAFCTGIGFGSGTETMIS